MLIACGNFFIQMFILCVELLINIPFLVDKGFALPFLQCFDIFSAYAVVIVRRSPVYFGYNHIPVPFRTGRAPFFYLFEKVIGLCRQLVYPHCIIGSFFFGLGKTRFLFFFLFVITERRISSSKILLCGRKTVFGIDIEIYLEYFRFYRRFVFFESIPFGAVSFCFLSEKCKLLFEILTIGDLSVTPLFRLFCSSHTFRFFFAFLVEFFLRKA